MISSGGKTPPTQKIDDDAIELLLGAIKECENIRECFKKCVDVRRKEISRKPKKHQF
jgi:hypothetical protein